VAATRCPVNREVRHDRDCRDKFAHQSLMKDLHRIKHFRESRDEYHLD